MGDRVSIRLVVKDVFGLWKNPTPESKDITGSFIPEGLSVVLRCQEISRVCILSSRTLYFKLTSLYNLGYAIFFRFA